MADESKSGKKRNTLLYNILFLVMAAGILLFLMAAPPETTVRLPHDEAHAKLFSMPKKEAEKHCEKCHRKGGESPLPKDHPPKYRCLFCHKR